MSETKFTPGPWEVIDRLSGSENHYGWRLVSRSGYLIGEIYPLGSDPTDEAQANAQLAKAAPDMYEALKDLLDQVDDYVYVSKALAAIAKADGHNRSGADKTTPALSTAKTKD